jgi:hypothetical protein
MAVVIEIYSSNGLEPKHLYMKAYRERGGKTLCVLDKNSVEYVAFLFRFWGILGSDLGSDSDFPH